MQKFLGICLLIFSCYAENQIPSYVKLCSRNNPNLSECITDSFNSLVPHMVKGIPEMKIQPIDPFILEKLTLDYGNGSSVNFDAELFDVKLDGLRNVKAEKFYVTPNLDKFEMQATLPSLKLSSKFKAKGKVLLVNIDSVGTFLGDFAGIKVKGMGLPIKFTRKGVEYRKFNEVECDIDIKKIKVNFENLLPREELNTNINQAINENIDVIYAEMKPLITETLKAILKSSLNNVHRTYPLDVLYPK